MLEGIYQNAAAMVGLEAWNNSIAQNISQSAVPGYKKAIVSFEGENAGSLGVQDNFGNILQRASVHTKGVGMVDYSDGLMRVTNGDYDFAVDGEGFFELQAPDGQYVYTRDGEFTVNNEGQLVSKQGYPVMTDNRDTIDLIPEGGKLQAAGDGTLRQNGQIIGQLGIRAIEKPSELVRSHGGFVLPEGSSDPARHVDEPLIRHATLELSNVSPTHEMINLITLSRSFEINQKVVQAHDERLGKAIQQLGGGR